MSDHWFFEKFELIADAPDAVAKMRVLVLELAFQGRLIPQHPEDEPASKLLEEIVRQKSNNSRRRNAGPSEAIAERQKPYTLPNSWIWTKLGNIADWGSGSTPARGNHEFYGGTISWLKSGELNDNRSLTGSEEQVTELALKKCSFRHNLPGDVLFAMYGATVGKVAILAEPAVTNQAVCGCTPYFGVLNQYLYFYLLSQRQCFRNASEGGAQPNFSKDKILTYPFPLPPLAEQKRIVAKVDELMALCDQLEAQQKERETRKSALVRASLSRFAETPTPANLDFLFHKSYDIPPAELRKSILSLAVQGQLVPHDPNDEPAQHAITRTIMEKNNLIRAGMIAKQPSLPSISESDLPFEVPSSWVWIRLESICEVITKGSSPNWQGIQYVDNAESGVLFITSENVGNYSLRKMDEPKFVERRFNDMESRSILQRNDLLVNLVGASIGRTAIYDRDVVANINQAVGIVRLVRGQDAVENWYLLHYLNSPTSLKIMFEEQVETARANLSLTNMKHFLVPIPPLAEQRRIVAKVDQLMALVDELERQLETSRKTASKLLEAVVHEITNTASFAESQ